MTPTPSTSSRPSEYNAEPECECVPERLPHSCWAEQWLVRWAATSWRCYGQYIAPHVEADDFTPGPWARAFAALKARQPLPDDVEERVLTYWSTPGTEPTGADIPRMIVQLKDMAARRRLVWAAQTIAESAWRTDKPFTATDARRILAWTERSGATLKAAA